MSVKFRQNWSRAGENVDISKTALEEAKKKLGIHYRFVCCFNYFLSQIVLFQKIKAI